MDKLAVVIEEDMVGGLVSSVFILMDGFGGICGRNSLAVRFWLVEYRAKK
jgi:hypothetical protein